MEKKIIHVPRCYAGDSWNEQDIILRSLVERQLARGWTPEIHTSQAINPIPNEEIDGLRVNRYPQLYPYWGMTMRDRDSMDQYGGNALSIPLFFELLKLENAQIFHSHTLERLGGIAYTISKKQKKPFLITLYADALEPMPPLPSHIKLDCGKLFSWYFPSHHALLKKANAVICVNVKEYHQAALYLKHDRIFQVGRGIDEERFAYGDGRQFRMENHIPLRATVIVCFSSFEAENDQLCLLEAFKRLATGYPDLFLVLIGTVKEVGYWNRIEQSAISSSCKNRIRLLEWLSSDEEQLPNAYNASNIFVLPASRESQPLSPALLEAWAAGLPLVAAETLSLQDIVIEGKNGFFFNIGNFIQLAEKLEALIKSTPLCKSLGANGQHLVNENYTWSQICSQTEAVYQIATEHFYEQNSNLA